MQIKGQEFSFTPGRIVFGIVATLAMFGTMMYVRLGFQKSDVKLAVQLVESANVHGVLLKDRLNAMIPLERRLCTALVTSEFYGHMQVTCVDVKNDATRFEWKVNVTDGMVVPLNEAAKKLEEAHE